VAFRGPERRLRTRFRVRLPFVLQSNSQQVEGTTVNLSLLGISAYTQGPLNREQQVTCLIRLPEQSHPITVNGTVIRCDPLSHPHPDGSYQTGVFFKQFTEPSAEATLTRFLNRKAQEEQEALKAGYQALRQKMAERRRRRRLEAARKRRMKLKRLRRRRKRLAELRRKKRMHRRRGRPPKRRSARKSPSKG
jgi:hypothetical protein